MRALARSPDRRTFSRETVPEAVRRIVESLNQPAYVTGRRWETHAAAEIFTDFGGLAEEDRDILVYMLTDPGARRLFGTGWADEAKRMVAQFRATHDLWAGDPEFLELLDCLRQGAPEFAPWWEAHEIRSPATGQKWLHHPEKACCVSNTRPFRPTTIPR